jgi:catechol 2,3-dioxygenase-like lactoylglutathione lyase family enzyme
MKITGIHHYAIVVSDLERSVGFYRDILNLDEIPIPETFYAAGISARWLAVGSGQIHLIRGDEPQTASRRHAALIIENAATARQLLMEKGFMVHETTPIPGYDRFFTADPDGNRLELIQSIP